MIVVSVRSPLGSVCIKEVNNLLNSWWFLCRLMYAVTPSQASNERVWSLYCQLGQSKVFAYGHGTSISSYEPSVCLQFTKHSYIARSVLKLYQIILILMGRCWAFVPLHFYALMDFRYCIGSRNKGAI